VPAAENGRTGLKRREDSLTIVAMLHRTPRSIAARFRIIVALRHRSAA